MIIKDLLDEDFVNYKLPSMFIVTSICSFKCDAECGTQVCQNSSLAHAPDYYVVTDTLIRRYLENPISKAVVFGGLEPFDQFDEMLDFITKLRLEALCTDPIVIYTGYREDEIPLRIELLSAFDNIIVKFGRFIPGHVAHFDDVLGVKLASDNQYAKRIS